MTPLSIEVQEDATSGQVRATIKDATSDKYVTGVHVKVIGSNNADFTSGETDLRGVYVADGVNGTTTVIARLADNRYAFYRGSQHLGAPSANAAPEQPQSQVLEKKGDDGLLDQLRIQNDALIQGQEQNLKEFYKQGKDSLPAAEAASEAP